MIIKKLFDFVGNYIPLVFLPKYYGHNIDCSLPENQRSEQRYLFDEKQTREKWSESSYNFLQIKLNKYSPIRLFKNVLRRKWRQRVEKTVFELVGEITLIHAGLEHRLQAFLIEYFGISEEKITKKSGNQLREELNKKAQQLPDNEVIFLDLKRWSNEFEIHSKSRNESVKAIYAYDDIQSKISKVDLPMLAGFRKKMLTGQFTPANIHNWIKEFNIEDLKKIRRKSLELNQAFASIEGGFLLYRIKSLSGQICP